MTKIIDRNVGTGYRAYVCAYFLNESGISAASGSSFNVTWIEEPYRVPEYASVFLENVDQLTPIGEQSSNSTESSKLFTDTIWIVAVPELFCIIDRLVGCTYCAKSGSENALTEIVA